MELFRQEYWSAGVHSCSLLQGIFPTQGSNLGLLYCKQILYQLSHEGGPIYIAHGTLLKSYVAVWMAGELGGEQIHVYVWLSPFTI